MSLAIDLSTRTALVTGAASGIGRACALALAEAGARIIAADIDAAGGEAVAAAVGGLFLPTNLAQREACQALARAALAQGRPVDILVNVAGFQHIDPIQDFPEEKWDTLLAVMLTAPFLLTKYLWPAMQAQGWGRIINLASVHGLVASPFKSAYITAKHGLIGLTRTTALEGGPHGITVNAICPAYVRTPLVERQIADQARTRGLSEADVIERVMLEPAAIKRLIEPEEVAAMALYLCSDAARGITGAALTLDLGWTAR
ncbi:MAG: 3-hydroxybutyrate dehydrogenase [Caldilineales bacterium]|nr:3-hydroxybutyrate dehydrogenase [Caldilineales bacterium]